MMDKNRKKIKNYEKKNWGRKPPLDPIFLLFENLLNNAQ